MARTKFELLYPHDGSRKQIGCSERNSLLIANQIKQIGPTSYKFIGEVSKKFHGFMDFAEWRRVQLDKPAQRISDTRQSHLDNLTVIWVLRDERERQSEETPGSLEDRLDAMGFQPKPIETAA